MDYEPNHKEKEHLRQILTETAEAFNIQCPEIRFKKVRQGHWTIHHDTKKEEITFPDWIFTQREAMQEHMALHEISHSIANKKGGRNHDAIFQEIESRTHSMWNLWLGHRKKAYVECVIKNGVQYAYDWVIARTAL